MFYRSAIFISVLGGLLLVIALITIILVPWISSKRLDPLYDHMSLTIVLEDHILQLENVLKTNSNFSDQKSNYVLKELTQDIDQLADSKKFLSSETPTFLMLVHEQLAGKTVADLQTVRNALLTLRGAIKSESNARQNLLSKLHDDSRLLLKASIIVAIMLGILTILLVLNLSRRLLRPLNDLGYLLKRIARQDFTSALPDRIDPILKPIFVNYNAMVERLVTYEQSHESREQGLQEQVSGMARALLKQHTSLSRAQHLAATGEVAASLAHELRNPLAGVIVTLNNLRQDVKEADSVERLDLAINELKRTTRLLNELLEKAHRKPEVMTKINVSESVYNVFTLLQHEFSDHITLKSDMDQDLQCLLQESGFRQVLMNLMLNASQAIGKREGTIAVEASMEGDNVLIKICDDGPGFPEDMLRNGICAFDSRRVGGTGLGLPMVKRFVSDINGEIQLSNQDPQGACIALSLPSTRCE